MKLNKYYISIFCTLFLISVGCGGGVPVIPTVANLFDWDSIVNKFEFLLYFYIHIHTNTQGKGMNIYIHLNYGLNSATTVLLQR